MMFATPRILLIITAILGGVAGFLALIVPPLFLQLTFPGVDGGPAALYLTRAFGVALISFAVLAFFSRGLIGVAVRPALAALLTYNVVVTVHFGSLALSGDAAMTAPLIHLLLSVGYAYYWHKSR